MLLLVTFCMAVALAIYSAKGQDNSWVDQLQNQQKSVCCFDNDGRRLTNPDWDTLGKVDADYNGS